jgi:arylsulfatase A-like enzyme
MTKTPDIVFIVLDTQRADRLGCYGNKRPLTPNLDRFAAQGTLFERAVSPAQWTIPSHASFFSGLYPTVHQVTQSNHSLSPDVPHLAEVLRDSGYQTVGFCNNPLVGILNNGFKRGFHTFYNYGGAIPSVPQHSSSLPWPLSRLSEAYTQFLRRISYPIQNFFGRSDLAFRLSLNAWMTPLWSRFANFKGQNHRSVQDVVEFLRRRENQQPDKPLFLFLNLMETHLPFWPPGEYVDRVAPYFRQSREARNVMRRWNREAYRWASPLPESLSDLEQQVLNDMYDAEVAYQDDYLGQLLVALNGRSRRRDTLTVIVSDHGDGLGEHGYFGHAFVAYDELVHVPLILHWPAQLPAMRVETPVSTRRVYHTILSAAGQIAERPNLDPATVRGLSLQRTIYGSDPEQGTAFSEVYPPLNFVRAIEQRSPELLDAFRCLSLRRAVVKPDESCQPLKLITVDDAADELFDLKQDPLECDNILETRTETAVQLTNDIQRMTSQCQRRQEQLTAGRTINLESDDQLMKRLRGLGYLD